MTKGCDLGSKFESVQGLCYLGRPFCSIIDTNFKYKNSHVIFEIQIVHARQIHYQCLSINKVNLF